MKMKKIVFIMVLAIVIIGCGAKSKFGAQFSYQLDLSNGDRVQAMKAFAFEQLDDKTLEQAAQEMEWDVFWSDKETTTGSVIITAEGIAEFNYLAEHTPYSLSFRVLEDGRMEIEDAELSDEPADAEQVLKLIHQTVEVFNAVDNTVDPSNQADRFIISVHKRGGDEV